MKFQVISYQPGQLYCPHMDTNPATTAATPGGQRTATVLLYLNDVEEGGATEFVELGIAVEPVSKSYEFRIKNEDLCIKNEGFF